MSLAGRDIVCLSSHYWDERRFRKQEFMSRFARRNRVLFVEPTFSLARRPEPHRHGVATNHPLRVRVERREAGLWLAKPPRGLPRWSDPRIERLTYARFGRLIARTCRRLGLEDPIVWVYHQSWYHGLERIPRSKLVFDLVDDLAAYGGDQSAHLEHIERTVEGLVRGSDLLVTTAKPLLETYGPLAHRAVQIANGFDGERFAPERIGEVPDDLRDLPRPLVGFVGTLFKFLDFDLLESVARLHPDKTLVLVGPVEEEVGDRVARLTALPNVAHLGARPQADIPRYVSGFDVCVNPFRASRVATAVNPLKVYEYLAAGRPVVSTPMRALEMEDAGRFVAFADGPEAFAEQLDRCLQPDVQRAADERRDAVAPYSWEALWNRLDAACEAALGH